MRAAIAWIACATLIACGPAAAGQPQRLKVACIGNSITAGVGVEDPATTSYPAELQRMLGSAWEVRNFGVSGRTLLRRGDFPYWNEPAFTAAHAFSPDLVIIKLGTNDSKPQNWKFSAEFDQNLRELVASFRTLDSHPRIFLCTPVPAFPGDWGISDSVVREGVVPIVRSVARSEGLTLVDLYGALSGKAEFFPDKVHPNEEGALAMAWEIYRVICTEYHRAQGVQPLLPLPSERQMTRQELAYYGFLHFTVNTFTDKEWGYGDESPAIFNPTEFDAEAIARTAKEAGMRGLVLTCKHHDGFCLWPSRYTDHSVKGSPWREGRGDVVRELSDACRKTGLKFGVYLSPWDRNRADYGRPEYLDYFRNQLTELLTQYGEIAEVWFDGANGGDGYYGGARESRIIDRSSYYHWPELFALVRRLQPNAAVFSDVGPDIRWVGNENGFAGETCWSMYAPVGEKGGEASPGDTRYQEAIEGHRDGRTWMPAECDVSIRPGWFYHAAEDSLVKSPSQLFDLYLSSVGRNACLLLNVPPDRRGRLHEQDVKSLKGLKTLLDETFRLNLAAGKQVSSASHGQQFETAHLTDGRLDTYWSSDDSVASFTVDLGAPSRWNLLLLQEEVRLGQRVERFSVESWDGRSWTVIGSGTTIGYKRLLSVPATTSRKVRVTIRSSRSSPAIAEIGLYLAPERGH
jgi:alpha-L-fucosidase